jgi:hypothetical protein
MLIGAERGCQGNRPLRTAFSRRGRVEVVELGVSIQLAPPIARAGRLVQVVPHAIQDDPCESTYNECPQARQMSWVCIAFAIDADVLMYSRCFKRLVGWL